LEGSCPDLNLRGDGNVPDYRETTDEALSTNDFQLNHVGEPVIGSSGMLLESKRMMAIGVVPSANFQEDNRYETSGNETKSKFSTNSTESYGAGYIRYLIVGDRDLDNIHGNIHTFNYFAF